MMISKTTRKWRQIKMISVPLKSAWAKTFFTEIIVPIPEQQGKSLFCFGSTDLSPVFFVVLVFFFFFIRPSGLPEHHRGMLNGSFESYFEYLRDLFLNSTIFK